MLNLIYMQLMLQRGFLATTAFYASLAHTDDIIDRYLVATALAKDDVHLQLNL